MRYKEFIIEGRNAVLEAFRAGKTIDKLFVLDGCQDGPVKVFCGKPKRRIPLSILWIKNGWTDWQTADITRALLRRRQHMNMRKSKIF